MTGLLPLAIIAWSRSGVLRIDELRTELLTLYVTDELRRLVCESAFPLLFKRKRDREIADSIAVANHHHHQDYKDDAPQQGQQGKENEGGGGRAEPRDSHSSVLASAAAAAALEVQAVTEHEADEYDTFDDYLEMIQQFAYLTVRKTVVLSHLYIKMHHFTKTGSGQT
jgi:hypothetical protein